MIRNAKEDNLITPENSLLVLIDYQPAQVQSVNSMDRAKLIENITLVARIARLYKLPVVLSTVNARGNPAADTLPALRQILGKIPSYDRTMINAWEDREFHAAVKSVKRKKLLMAALWTEACLTFPTLDAIAEGYEVYPIADAVGGTSAVAHETAMKRMIQAGAHPISVVQLACELQRDWARTKTVPDFTGIMTDAGAFLRLG